MTAVPLLFHLFPDEVFLFLLPFGIHFSVSLVVVAQCCTHLFALTVHIVKAHVCLSHFDLASLAHLSYLRLRKDIVKFVAIFLFLSVWLGFQSSDRVFLLGDSHFLIFNLLRQLRDLDSVWGHSFLNLLLVEKGLGPLGWLGIGMREERTNGFVLFRSDTVSSFWLLHVGRVRVGPLSCRVFWNASLVRWHNVRLHLLGQGLIGVLVKVEWVGGGIHIF